MKSGMVISMLVIVLQLIAHSQCETIIVLASMNEVCPGTLQCTTLQQYASNPTLLNSGIVLELQPGNHTLNSELSATNLDNFTITGNNSRVVCTSASAEISFTSVQHVFITEVSFIGCDENMLSSNGDSVEIRNVVFNQNRINIVESVNTLIVMDSVFDGNSDTGLDLSGIVSTVTIESCVFSNNGHRAITAVSSDLEISGSTFMENRGPQGGCIQAQSSTVTIRYSNFTQCESVGERDGGAIYGQQVTFTITDTNFTDNEGYGGGAIGGTYSSFNITSSNFIRNIGIQWGGAIKADTGTRLFTLADSNFISNIASKGAGVYTQRLDSLDSCSLINNTATSDGGGLWVQTVQSMTISNCNFLNNTNNERGGGAYIEVRSVVDNISLNILGTSFSDNIAGRGHGGGVHFSSNGQYANIRVAESSFTNNTATSSQESLRNRNTVLGGGIYMFGDNSYVFVDSSDFTMNCASGSGGGVYVSGSVVINASHFTENSALLGEGGAIHSDGQNANVTLINSMFDYNSAPSCGVLDVNKRFHVVEFKDCSLTHNTATGMEIGGGVCCISSASVSIMNTNMSHNSANMNGGVFYINDGVVQIESSNFMNNSAEGHGGVVYTYIHAVSYNILDSTFSQNTARNNGGVLFIGRRGCDVRIEEGEFSYNSAIDRGGVISIVGSDVIFNTTSLYNNTASKGSIISACNSIVSIYNYTELIQTQVSRDACTYFDSVSSYSLTEPINGTNGSSQATCANCDMFTILTSSGNYCPGEFTGDPCLTLQQYVGSPSYGANISLILEPGNHTLTGELVASNTYNFTILGSNAKVMCITSAAEMSLTSVQHVLITGVSFIGCDRNVLSSNGDSVELKNVVFNRNRINIIESVNTIIVKESVFDGNSDTGLDLSGIVSTVTIESCVFSNNGHRAITAVSSDLQISRSSFLENRGPQGGCIRAQSSMVTVRDSNFTQCESVGGLDGGAIYGQQVTFTITDTNFTDNEGYQGGAIGGASSSFNITSSNFIRNIGALNGGAIYADINTISLIFADINFISNIGSSGGAVFAYRLDSLVCCNFINNIGERGNGGGLYLQTLLSITISYCNFWNNTNVGGGFGGAGASIFVNSDNISVNVVGSSFVNNTSVPGHGGGLLLKSNGQHASMIVRESNFRNNSANLHESRPHIQITNGGGLYLTGSGSVFVYSSDFSMNSASISGGAIYATGSISVNNSTISNNKALMGEGGAIVSNQPNAYVSVAQTTFIQNTAPICGVISVQSLNHVVSLVDSSFTYNEGTDNSNGGGVACFNSSSISIVTCSFLNNMANYHGGVFLIQNSSFRIEDSIFHDNFASSDGGVVYASTAIHTLSTINRCSFIQNTAGRDGGVLFIENTGNQLNINQSTFSDNNATSRGGVIQVSESTVQITESNIFNNTADLGDAIHACDSVITFPDSQFSVSTDSSNCTFYNGNINNFSVVLPTLDISYDTNLTVFVATCPFEYNSDVVDSTTASITETITTTTKAATTIEEMTETITTTTEAATTTKVMTEAITTTKATTTTEGTADTTITTIAGTTTNTTEATDAITATEQTSGTFNQETTAPITTAAMNTESNSFSGASTLSGAAIGGIVACLALLLILFTSIIGGYCLYRSVHKKSGKYSPKESKQEIGMTLTFKNENFGDHEVQNVSDIKSESSEEDIKESTIFEEAKDDKAAEYMKCPVCKDIQVDPCTLQCGHTVCQLCLACMWKHGDQVCPVCKNPWQVFPAVTIDYRDNIESVCSDEVAQLRKSYTSEDKELIKEFLSTKLSYSLKPVCDTHEQELDGQDCVKEEFKQDVTSFEEPPTSASIIESSVPPSSQFTDDRGNISDSENWHSHSVNYPNTIQPDEHIYAAPRHKSVGSKLSLKLSHHLRIRSHPESNTNIKCHDNVTLSVSATGAKPLYYKWRRNGKDITHPKCSGIDTPTLFISYFSPENQGDYTCIVSDDQEAIESVSAKLMLDLQITKHPQFPLNVKYGDYVVVFVSAVGEQKSLSYRWKLNGKDINLANCTGTNTRVLVIKSCSLEHQGTYTCTVSNIQGVVESKPAELKLAMEFSSSMSADDFFLWLQLRGLSEADRQLLKREKITASEFEMLDPDTIKELKPSVGGRIKLVQLLDEMKARCNVQNTGITAVEQEHLASLKGLEVRIRDLQLLKCCDRSGKTMQTLNIINQLSHKWRDIATLISKDTNKADILSVRFNNDPSPCLRQLFLDCFINNKPDGGRYSQDWKGVIELIEDVQEETLAEKVKKMVANIYNKNI